MLTSVLLLLSLQASPFYAGGADYTVELDESLISPFNEPSTRFWGGSTERENRFVSRLIIRRKGDLLWVPRSVYADLANCHGVELAPSIDGATVSLRGGDASSSYTVVISIQGEEIVSRKVMSGEFPNNHYEQTTYVNTPPSDY